MKNWRATNSAELIAKIHYNYRKKLFSSQSTTLKSKLYLKIWAPYFLNILTCKSPKFVFIKLQTMKPRILKKSEV